MFIFMNNDYELLLQFLNLRYDKFNDCIMFDIKNFFILHIWYLKYN